MQGRIPPPTQREREDESFNMYTCTAFHYETTTFPSLDPRLGYILYQSSSPSSILFPLQQGAGKLGCRKKGLSRSDSLLFLYNSLEITNASPRFTKAKTTQQGKPKATWTTAVHCCCLPSPTGFDNHHLYTITHSTKMLFLQLKSSIF